MAEAERALVLDDAERLLSLEEVSARLGSGRPFVGRLIQAGLLQALSFRRIKRVPKSELTRFIQDHLGEDLYATLEARERMVRA
jgi:excisionase family DNA binding protein